MLGRTAESTIIGFCPRSGGEPSIEGELEVSDDQQLRAARWHVRVEHDDEDAGGEASFGTGVLGGRRYLVAIRGSRWRRADRGHYEQERFDLAAWRFGESLAAATTGWDTTSDLGKRP